MKNIAIVFGGKSPEHSVSIISAKNIYNALDKNLYTAILIGISKEGKWYLEEANHHQQTNFEIGKNGIPLALVPGEKDNKIIRLDNYTPLPKIDAMFPITHGPNGEDGSIQAIFNQLDIAFVGPDVLGSAVAMDKDVCKRLFMQAGIGCADGIVAYSHEKDTLDYQQISKVFGSILFIKPANMGSSIGVNKATDVASFNAGISDAFLYDSKILIEKAVEGRELECAVLGNENPIASTLGEVKMNEGFYDFESKYVNDDAELTIPASNLSESDLKLVKETAIKAYKTLNV